MRLVIDANIAQSAGTSDVPISLHSRECLSAIRDNGHNAIFSEQLRVEWKEHASRLSRQWWKSMSARRRIERAEGEQFAALQDQACSCFANETRKAAFAKDFHLVRTALAVDHTILSNEIEFPGLLAAAATSIRALSAIYYGNPSTEGDVCIEWIRGGAMPVATRAIEGWLGAGQRKAD